MSAPLDAGEVAIELGISRDLFLRTRKALEAAGFPKPLPLVSRPQTPAEREKFRRTRRRPPLRWDAGAVADWKRDPRPERQRQAANDDGPRIRASDRKLIEERFGT